jgi:hypothetical protein
MMKRMFIVMVVGLILAACNGNNASGGTAASAIEAYINARGTSSVADLQALSCKAWESGAQTESDSFKSLKAQITGLACAQTGTDGQYALITCKGTMTTTYNGESRNRDLSTRGFKAVMENGSWKMCGYQADNATP